MRAQTGPVTRESPPLGAAQLALWGRLARPGDPAARHGQYMDLRGPLDRDALTAAIQRVIAETPALALRFADPGNGPRQAAGLPPMPGFADLSAQPAPVAQALGQMRADLCRPLDPAQEPAGALALFVISPTRHLLFLRADALALDACGMACLGHRIALHYAELLARAPARPEPEPAPETEPAPAPEPDRGPESQPPAGCDPDPAAPLPADLVRSIERLAQETGVPWADVLTALSAVPVLRSGRAPVPVGLPRRPSLAARTGPPPVTAETILPYRPRLDPEIPLRDWLRGQAALIDRLRRGDEPPVPPDDPGRVVIDVQPFARAPRFPGLRTVGPHVLAAAPTRDLRLVFRGTPRGGIRLEAACGPHAPLAAAEVRALAQGLPAFLAAAVASASLGRIAGAHVAPDDADRRRQDGRDGGEGCSGAGGKPQAGGDEDGRGAAAPSCPAPSCPGARAHPPSGKPPR